MKNSNVSDQGFLLKASANRHFEPKHSHNKGVRKERRSKASYDRSARSGWKRTLDY